MRLVLVIFTFLTSLNGLTSELNIRPWEELEKLEIIGVDLEHNYKNLSKYIINHKIKSVFLNSYHSDLFHLDSNRDSSNNWNLGFDSFFWNPKKKQSIYLEVGVKIKAFDESARGSIFLHRKTHAYFNEVDGVPIAVFVVNFKKDQAQDFFKKISNLDKSIIEKIKDKFRSQTGNILNGILSSAYADNSQIASTYDGASLPLSYLGEMGGEIVSLGRCTWEEHTDRYGNLFSQLRNFEEFFTTLTTRFESHPRVEMKLIACLLNVLQGVGGFAEEIYSLIGNTVGRASMDFFSFFSNPGETVRRVSRDAREGLERMHQVFDYVWQNLGEVSNHILSWASNSIENFHSLSPEQKLYTACQVFGEFAAAIGLRTVFLAVTSAEGAFLVTANAYFGVAAFNRARRIVDDQAQLDNSTFSIAPSLVDLLEENDINQVGLLQKVYNICTNQDYSFGLTRETFDVQRIGSDGKIERESVSSGDNPVEVECPRHEGETCIEILFSENPRQFTVNFTTNGNENEASSLAPLKNYIELFLNRGCRFMLDPQD